jgi:Flp pilus assembly protein TadG
MEVLMITQLISRLRKEGQSLTETALFLPVLVILIGGVVEISTMLVTQNRVSTAARAATGFGATHFKGADWDDTAYWSEQMATVARNNVTETLDLALERWDIWTIKATLNDAGGYSEWTPVHAYGNSSVVTAAEWATFEAEVQQDVLDALDTNSGGTDPEGLEIVSTIAYHNRESFLGLNGFDVGPFTRIRGLTVMRVDDPAPYLGCPLLPIAVRLNQYSAYPSNWIIGQQYNEQLYPNDPATQLFPEGTGPNGGFEYPNPEPVYINDPGVDPPRLKTSTFKTNIPGVPLRHATQGLIYWAREQGPSGSFGWLSWDGSPAASDLRDSLTFPGNFPDMYPGGPADGNYTGDPPSAGEPVDGDTATGDGNGLLQIGEWVENSTGNIASAVPLIDGYIDSGLPVTLIVYDITNGKTGENANYRVAGFIKVRLVGYSFQGNNDSKWIVFETIGWANECKK